MCFLALETRGENGCSWYALGDANWNVSLKFFPLLSWIAQRKTWVVDPVLLKFILLVYALPLTFREGGGEYLVCQMLNKIQ